MCEQESENLQQLQHHIVEHIVAGRPKHQIVLSDEGKGSKVDARTYAGSTRCIAECQRRGRAERANGAKERQSIHERKVAEGRRVVSRQCRLQLRSELAHDLGFGSNIAALPIQRDQHQHQHRADSAKTPLILRQIERRNQSHVMSMVAGAEAQVQILKK